jgi:hypothetical protein
MTPLKMRFNLPPVSINFRFVQRLQIFRALNMRMKC